MIIKVELYKKKLCMLIAILTIITSTISTVVFATSSSKISKSNDYLGERSGPIIIDYIKNSYDQYLIDNSTVEKYNGDSISIQAYLYESFDGESPIITTIDKSNKEVLRITDKTKSISWKISAPKTAMYEIEFKYSQVESKNPIIRKNLKINGSTPFAESEVINFYRFYEFESRPIVNRIGDETLPMIREVPRTVSESVKDLQGLEKKPYLFLLNEGDNLISLDNIAGELTLEEISIKAQVQPLSYKEVLASYKNKGLLPSKSEIKIESENCFAIQSMNSTEFTLIAVGDPTASPSSYKNKLMNYLAGFKRANSKIEWKFYAKEDGLYKIGVRYYQFNGEGLTTGQTIRIDNEIKFKEMEDYRFNFNRTPVYESLSNGNEDYLFYLKKGDHTISFTSNIGVHAQYIKSMKSISRALGELVDDITKITTTQPDTNYDYEFEKNIPDLIGRLKSISSAANSCLIGFNNLSFKTPAVSNNLLSFISAIDQVIKNPEDISSRYGSLKNYILNIEDWATKVSYQELSLDYVMFLPSDKKVINYKSSIIQKLYAGFYQFFNSFFKDYDAMTIGNDSSSNSLNVWVSRSKEWGETIQQLSDSDFTQKYNTNVIINILPSGSIGNAVNPLLLAINSGKAPDVVLSVPAGVVCEYSMRGVIMPLNNMPNFNEIKSRFPKGNLTTVTYKNKLYALPETSNFRVMFYRKDILNNLKINIPQTWDDVYNDTLPRLFQNNKQMYFPPIVSGTTINSGIFDTFLYQNGGNFYRDNGRISDLDTEIAFKSLKEYTELYSKYGIPVSANFYNRFRTGEIPIGIEGFSAYMQIYSAAPEIFSKWSITLIPGKKMLDGSINRTTGGCMGETCVIMNASKHKNESMKFIDWWTSQNVQSNFARIIETKRGPMARWNTANIEAFESLPWTSDEIDIIKQTWEFTKEQEVVLGGILANRNLSNALNKTIIQKTPIRDALEEAVEQTNIDLAKKQSEY